MSVDHAVVHESKRDQLLHLLFDLAWHDHYELRAAGGVRYSARLLELKRLGYSIESCPIGGTDGKSYRLLSRSPGQPQGKKVKVFLDEYDAELLLGGYVAASSRVAIADALESFRANREKL